MNIRRDALVLKLVALSPLVVIGFLLLRSALAPREVVTITDDLKPQEPTAILYIDKVIDIPASNYPVRHMSLISVPGWHQSWCYGETATAAYGFYVGLHGSAVDHYWYYFLVDKRSGFVAVFSRRDRFARYVQLARGRDGNTPLELDSAMYACDLQKLPEASRFRFDNAVKKYYVPNLVFRQGYELRDVLMGELPAETDPSVSFEWLPELGPG